MSENSPNRWSEIKRIVDQALQLPPEDRDTFVLQACHNDTAMQDEVKSLLRHDEAAKQGGFLESLQTDALVAVQERPTGPISQAADWNLLFGLLALQNGLISRDELVAAFAKWTSDKSSSMAKLLVDDGAISADTSDRLRQMVELHVQLNGGEPHKSLMSLSGSDLPTAIVALAQLDDEDLDQSIGAIPKSESPTALPPTVGQSTSGGGRFRILRPLPSGRGGMGEISVAKDEELGREVALKQILTDIADHSGYREKFQIEAEITGNLEHPGIVPIYGLGAGNDGRPYYAMRLVHGDNLSSKIKQFHEAMKQGTTDYDSLEFRGLIDRLIDVAQAVRYAHSRGVLHRDLKPGNILVGKYGETLVIDWGLARLPRKDHTADESSDGRIDSQAPLKIRSGSQASETLQGQALGTVGYAPPEQVNGRVDLITERSDVYALGAILYQMLTGRRPVGQDTKGNLAALIQDTIAGDITPPRDISRSSPKAISAICMKALQREAADRYESVAVFIDEIERWKADQPIDAAPDTIADRVLRLVRRYRAAVLASTAALLVIALVTGVALVLVNVARMKESTARQQAQLLADEKTELAKRNQQVVDAFVAAFRSPDPENVGVTSQMTALQVLEQAQARLETDDTFESDELTKGTLLSAVAKSLLSLGAFDQAVSSNEKVYALMKSEFGAEHRETLVSMNNLGSAYVAVGRFDDAISLLQETLRMQVTILGVDHAETLKSRNQLAAAYARVGRLSEAIALQEENSRFYAATKGDDHPDTLASMGDQASFYAAAGRLADSIPIQEKISRLSKGKWGADHPKTLTVMNNLGGEYMNAGRLAEGLPQLEESVRLTKAKLGEDHPTTLFRMGNLAEAYTRVNRFSQAMPLFEETLRLTKAKLGEDHPDTLRMRNHLALCYSSAGRPEDALPLAEESLRLSQTKLGIDHPHTLTAMYVLGTAYRNVGRLTDAFPILEESLRLRKAKFGENHPQSLNTMQVLAGAYFYSERWAEAMTLMEEILRIRKVTLGAEHPNTLTSMNDLALCYKKMERFSESLALFQETLHLNKAVRGAEHPETLTTMHNLAGVYTQTGRLSEAILLFKETIRRKKNKLGAEHRSTLFSMNDLGRCYQAAGMLDEALPLLQESHRLIRSKLGDEHFKTLKTLNGLQSALLQAGQYEDARKLTELWIEILNRSASPDPGQLAEAHTSLADAMLEMRNFDEAAEQINLAIAMEGLDEFQRWRAKSIQGAILASNNKWQDAEPLLVESFKALRNQLTRVDIHNRWHVSRACQRVIDTYEAWTKPDKVDEWQAERDRVKAEIDRLRQANQPTEIH